MKHLFFICLILSSYHVFSQSKPNVIFIISDDHTWQAISAYGSKIAKTPNIDRIAKQGAILMNNVVTNSICGPSRATLLTGKYSHINGYKLNEKVFDINQAVFPEELQKVGYQTAWVGKMHLGALPHGFDYLNVLPGHGQYYNSEFIDKNNVRKIQEGYVTDVVTKLSKEFLESRDTKKPFFMVVGHKATHRNWLPAEQDLGAYDQVNFTLPTNFYDKYDGRLAAKDQDMSIEKTMIMKDDLKMNVDFDTNIFFKSMSASTKAKYKEYYGKIYDDFLAKNLSGKALTEWKYQRYLKDYLAVANSLDRNIGELLDYLDQSGLAKNTVIVYCSDQGFYLGEHGWFDKRFIYEESLKTPFVIKYPGQIKPGSIVNQVVSNVDWAPTLLDIMGAKIPADFQGKSFLPVLKGQASGWKNEQYYHYYEYPQPHHVSPHFGIRTSQYTLARFYGPKHFWELYDIKKDPKNMHNLIGNKKYAAITIRLKQKLKAEAIRLKDDEALTILNN